MPEKKCQECGGMDEVIDGMCEECEQDHVYCDVCKEWHPRDSDKCRHLYWTDCGYSGAGSCDGEWDYCKESFFSLLDLLASIPRDGREGWGWARQTEETCLVSAMESRIAANNFWTFTHGFMLSMPELDFRQMRPDLGPDVGLAFAVVSSAWPRRWIGHHNEIYHAASDGFGWLTTLEADKTPEANAETVKWIREWREARKESPCPPIA